MRQRAIAIGRGFFTILTGAVVRQRKRMGYDQTGIDHRKQKNTDCD
jgi:hypothetical protein